MDHMTTTQTPALSRVALHTLIAVSRGQVSMPGHHVDRDLGTWRLGGPNGRAVTASVRALIHKGLARPSTEVVDGRRHAVATAEGHREISRAAHR
jgi:hypothetical protein